MGGKVGENPAALRAAVFSLSSKNRRGGGRSNAPPPSRARVNDAVRRIVSAVRQADQYASASPAQLGHMWFPGQSAVKGNTQVSHLRSRL